jgi:hypothetical protein
MTQISLANTDYETIKQHILDPKNSNLPEHLQPVLDRWYSATKLLDKYPIRKHALALHKKKFPHISLATAYRDLENAAKLYNSYQTFDYDFWLNWTLNDITENIKTCRNIGGTQERKIIAQEHANLLKAIGERPTEADDPNRHEKNSFYIMVNLNGAVTKVDLNNLKDVPGRTLRELNKMLFSGQEITDVEAEEIMNS